MPGVLQAPALQHQHHAGNSAGASRRQVQAPGVARLCCSSVQSQHSLVISHVLFADMCPWFACSPAVRAYAGGGGCFASPRSRAWGRCRGEGAILPVWTLCHGGCPDAGAVQPGPGFGIFSTDLPLNTKVHAGAAAGLRTEAVTSIAAPDELPQWACHYSQSLLIQSIDTVTDKTQQACPWQSSCKKDRYCNMRAGDTLARNMARCIVQLHAGSSYA